MWHLPLSSKSPLSGLTGEGKETTPERPRYQLVNFVLHRAGRCADWDVTLVLIDVLMLVLIVEKGLRSCKILIEVNTRISESSCCIYTTPPLGDRSGLAYGNNQEPDRKCPNT